MNRFTVGMIGTGGMGMTHLNNMVRFRTEGKVNIAAVCDVDENHVEPAMKAVGEGAKAHRDYRYILDRRDIDAVLIATPDHWHAVQTVHACQTGKHVYVEKPASVMVEEGRAMVTAARSNKVAVQVGAQARTAKGGWHTCRAIRNGIVGRVHRVRQCFLGRARSVDSRVGGGLSAGESGGDQLQAAARRDRG
jgi:predicted dehydrogenase